jgi:hypothetical protein
MPEQLSLDMMFRVCVCALLRLQIVDKHQVSFSRPPKPDGHWWAIDHLGGPYYCHISLSNIPLSIDLLVILGVPYPRSFGSIVTPNCGQQLYIGHLSYNLGRV